MRPLNSSTVYSRTCHGLRVSDMCLLGVVIISLPFGRSTRFISAMVSKSLRICSMTWKQSTKSILPDAIPFNGGMVMRQNSTLLFCGIIPAGGNVLSIVVNVAACGAIIETPYPLPVPISSTLPDIISAALT